MPDAIATTKPTKASELTSEIVREFLHYDPDTGVFTWKKRDRKWFDDDHRCNWWNARFAAQPALASVDRKGYRTGLILRLAIKASRAAFLYMEGRWPDPQVDHKNGVRSDNRW